MTFLLKLETVPVITFYQHEKDFGFVVGVGYDRLVNIGSLRRPVKVGGAAENANITVNLDNTDGFISSLWREPPLKVRGSIDLISGKSVTRIFTGTLTQLNLASTATITLEV